jgi:hypothetical protein
MRQTLARLALLIILVAPAIGGAAPASQLISVDAMMQDSPLGSPVDNSAFYPGAGVETAPAFAGTLRIGQSTMRTKPVLPSPVVDGRDGRLFPGVTLGFFTDGDLLIPVERGEMVRETATVATPSYWRVIPQVGRVWRESGDRGWSRAAFPIMLVNDTENAAHQGLATFLYQNGKVSALKFQFVQQTAPWLVRPHMVAWGGTRLELLPGTPDALDARRAQAREELARRLPAKPWSELLKQTAPGTLDGFADDLLPAYRVGAALIKDGTLYYKEVATPYGPYPYPLEMRFGVRSVTKSVGPGLSMLRLAQLYGPWVFTLRIGDYVKGLDPKYDRVRFLDAANMATGFGGTGTTKTNPNDIFDGYLGGDYDAWYKAPSNAEKLAEIRKNLKPYPWEPGTVMRYRDQDYYLLGVAIDGFLKSIDGPNADVWDWLQKEVLRPIGIYHAPAVRTREVGGKDGVIWFNAGYYPTLDDLAKIALLYQHAGEYNGQQLLNRQLTQDALNAHCALVKAGDAAVSRQCVDGGTTKQELYRTGFHYLPYVGSKSGKQYSLPSMHGSGDNEVVLYPNGLVSIRTSSADGLPEGTKTRTSEAPLTIQAVDRLAPF